LKFDGLLGAGKNLGYTSIVSSAVRLHGHGMAVGQAAATVAALALERNCQPRQIAENMAAVREVQTRLVSPPRDPHLGQKQPMHPGLLLWPYQDLPPDSPAFIGANQLAVRMILPGEPGQQDFRAEHPLTQGELAVVLFRAARHLGKIDDNTVKAARDSIEKQPDNEKPSDDITLAVAALKAAKLLPAGENLDVKNIATRGQLRAWLKQNQWPVHDSLQEQAPLMRGILATALWHAMQQPDSELQAKNKTAWITPGQDSDDDGVTDLSDPLPQDANNDSLPDILDLK
jgi:hypothetical protein